MNSNWKIPEKTVMNGAYIGMEPYPWFGGRFGGLLMARSLGPKERKLKFAS
jgi:hypothetical protein